MQNFPTCTELRAGIICIRANFADPGFDAPSQSLHCRVPFFEVEVEHAYIKMFLYAPMVIIEPWHGISNNKVCATSKASDQPAHACSLIRTFASRLNIL